MDPGRHLRSGDLIVEFVAEIWLALLSITGNRWFRSCSLLSLPVCYTLSIFCLVYSLCYPRSFRFTALQHDLGYLSTLRKRRHPCDSPPCALPTGRPVSSYRWSRGNYTRPDGGGGNFISLLHLESTIVGEKYNERCYGAVMTRCRWLSPPTYSSLRDYSHPLHYYQPFFYLLSSRASI